MNDKSFADILNQKLRTATPTPLSQAAKFSTPHISAELYDGLHSIRFTPHFHGNSTRFYPQQKSKKPQPKDVQKPQGILIETLSKDSQMAWKRLCKAVSADASTASLQRGKSFYRSLAKRLHPDHNPHWDLEPYGFLEMRTDYLQVRNELEKLEA